MEPSNSWLKTIWEDREKRVILGLCLFLILSTAAVYVQTGGFDFVDYDDPGNIKGNPKVPGGLTWDGVKWAFTAMYGSNWFPLIWLSHMLEVSIFGMNAGGFHLVNVALHIADTVLLFWVLRRYTRALWASFFVAALFALHPLHVESVAWVTERKDVLSTLFWLLTMLAYLRYVEGPTAKRYVLICVFCALGLMTKPMLVTLPFVLLLMDYWPLRRLLPENHTEGTSIWRLIYEKSPLFVLSVLSCMVTFIAQKTGGAVMRLSAIPIHYRIGNAVVSYCEYIIKMFKPVGLAVFYPHPVKAIAVGEIAASLAALAAVTIVVVLLRRRRYLLVGWLWYLGTLVPVIGIVQVGGQAMADRYTYIPLTGLFIMLVWLVGDLVSQWRHKGVIVGFAGSAILGVLGVMAFVQVGYWRDTMTLFKHAAAVTRDNYVAHSLLGARYAEKGDFDAAMQAFEVILKLTPKDADTLYNVAKSLAVQGKTDQAVEYYNSVLGIVPDDADTYGALALMQANQGHFERAIELYREGLSRKPEDGGLHGGLGSLFLQMGRVDEAISELELGVKLKEDSAIYGNLGMALLQKGDSDKTMEYLAKAIKLNADNAEAHFNIGNVYLSQGRLATAISEYEKAIKAKPKYARAYSNLAVVFAQMDKPDEAIINFRRAIEIEPNSHDVYFNLANVFMNKGQVDDAVENLRKGIELAPRDVRARYDLGKVLLLQNRAEEAMDEFKQVLRIDPNNLEAHYYLGNCYLSQKRLEEAVGEYQWAIQAKPDYFEAYSNLAVAFTRMGRVDEAIENFQAAAALEPDSPDAYFNLANVLSDKGKVIEAINTIRTAIGLAPADTRARCKLAELLLRKGEPGQAADEYEQVLKIDPANEEAKAGLMRIKEMQTGGTGAQPTGQDGQSLIPKSSLVSSDSNM